MPDYLIAPDQLTDYLLQVPTFFDKGVWEIQEHSVNGLRLLISCYSHKGPVRFHRHVVSLVQDPAVAKSYEEIFAAVARSEGREDLEIAVPIRSTPWVPALKDRLHCLVTKPREKAGPRSEGNLDIPVVYFQICYFATSRQSYEDMMDQTHDSRLADRAEHERYKWDKFMRVTRELNEGFRARESLARGGSTQAASEGHPADAPPDPDPKP